MNSSELVTIADHIRWAASRFKAAGLAFGHGTATALDEAAALVLHTLHMPPDLHDTWLHCRLTAAEREAVTQLVNRRIDERVPVPYLTGEAWFADLPFHVDARVLVPRSPIAELIEQGFGPWMDPEAVHTVADIGTGSGCIAIATAVTLPWVEVDAYDISDDALAVAARNVERHAVGDRVRLIRSDLMDARPADRRYDVIVSNPPYVDSAEMAALPPEFRHEPVLGLAGGDDGLALVPRLLEQAAASLSPGGVLICEVGASWPAMASAYEGWPLTWLEFARGGEGVFLIAAEDLRGALAARR